MLIAWMPFSPVFSQRATPGGQVKEIQGDTIRFLADSGFQPAAGDRT